LQIASHQGRWNRQDRLPGSNNYGLCEIDYILRNEYVEHLSDLVMRRTTLAITGSLTMNDLAQIASMAGDVLGWDKERISGEIDAVVGELSNRNLMQLR
jgi:glycerol-3-phosphate dehydrogenase